MYKIKVTKLLIMTWKLQLYHLDAKAVGWYLNEKKMDQNEGSRVLHGKFEEIQCLRICLDIQQKSVLQRMEVTGCEHNTYSHSCQYHTRSVSGGSGRDCFGPTLLIAFPFLEMTPVMLSSRQHGDDGFLKNHQVWMD